MLLVSKLRLHHIDYCRTLRSGGGASAAPPDILRTCVLVGTTFLGCGTAKAELDPANRQKRSGFKAIIVAAFTLNGLKVYEVLCVVPIFLGR